VTAHRSRARVPVLATGAAAVLLALAVAGCGGATPSGSGAPPPASPPPDASASLIPAASATPAPSVAVASPVEGLLTRLDAEGLVRVSGFRLRTDDGRELDFAMGVTENGVEFPPSHLAEHMATTSKVRVFFRDEAGARVVYRLEDAD
jgi:hypothetical protein